MKVLVGLVLGLLLVAPAPSFSQGVCDAPKVCVDQPDPLGAGFSTGPYTSAFTLVKGMVDSQVFDMVVNPPGASWSFANLPPYLSLTPMNGSGNTSVIMTVNALVEGDTGQQVFTVQTGGLEWSLPIRVRVLAPGPCASVPCPVCPVCPQTPVAPIAPVNIDAATGTIVRVTRRATNRSNIINIEANPSVPILVNGTPTAATPSMTSDQVVQ